MRSFFMATLGMLALAASVQAQEPGDERPSIRQPGVVADGGGPKVCVKEPKPATKVVYVMEIKEFCKPHTSFLDIITGRGCNDCNASCGACEVWTRRVLVKKIVPAKDVMKCVVKDAAGCETCAPAGMAPVKPR